MKWCGGKLGEKIRRGGRQGTPINDKVMVRGKESARNVEDWTVESRPRVQSNSLAKTPKPDLDNNPAPICLILFSFGQKGHSSRGYLFVSQCQPPHFSAFLFPNSKTAPGLLMTTFNEVKAHDNHHNNTENFSGALSYQRVSLRW